MSDAGGDLIEHFGQLALLDIDVVRTDAFRDELANRSKVIEKAAAGASR
jgi:hypothetical protein